jgi:hypothetical protein
VNRDEVLALLKDDAPALARPSRAAPRRAAAA